AIDDQPVDLVFALIVPAEAHDEHIKVLASLANAFNEDSFRQQLRDANSDAALYDRATAG
uniref:PTS sugar transporter subunit IIA n=1 Tax=Spongiibacter sp. TaxID=2024860 RepID=UPI00356A0EF5